MGNRVRIVDAICIADDLHVAQASGIAAQRVGGGDPDKGKIGGFQLYGGVLRGVVAHRQRLCGCRWSQHQTKDECQKETPFHITCVFKCKKQNREDVVTAIDTNVSSSRLLLHNTINPNP